MRLNRRQTLSLINPDCNQSNLSSDDFNVIPGRHPDIWDKTPRWLSFDLHLVSFHTLTEEITVRSCFTWVKQFNRWILTLLIGEVCRRLPSRVLGPSWKFSPWQPCRLLSEKLQEPAEGHLAHGPKWIMPNPLGANHKRIICFRPCLECLQGPAHRWQQAGT